MTVPVSPFLGIKGLQGPIYRLDALTNTPYLDDNNSFVILDNSGFYRIQVKDFDEVKKTVTIIVTPFSSKKRFIKKPDVSAYGGFFMTYYINNQDQVLDGSGNITKPGTFDTYFAMSVIRQANTCEIDKARELINSFDGSNAFQRSFPINFSTMTVDTITQNNIDNANA